jgi:glutamate-5-semialdehyde dehydrogenase
VRTEEARVGRATTSRSDAEGRHATAVATERPGNEQDAAAHVRHLADRAKTASRDVATASDSVRRSALERIASAIDGATSAILAANVEDVAAAQDIIARGELSLASLQRLRLDSQKLQEMAEQVRAVAALEDPIGRVVERTLLDDGLVLERVTCPLGLIAAVIEARPDAMTQITALALRSGNAVLLKVGTEATRTARVLLSTMHEALAAAPGVPSDAVAMVEGRPAVDALLSLDGVIDLVVPRGSYALVRSIQARTRIPVMGHADGICHVYVDAAADVDMAVEIVLDSKVQYPAACNSVEAVLIHADAAPRVVPPLVRRLKEAGVEIRGCARTRELVPDVSLTPASDADWGAEYGDLVLAMKVVDDIETAVSHVNNYGSGHTDAIVTADARAAEYFLSHVDSAGVFHNASTRFADGYRYGLGAEVGISTGKLHARGPVGLAGLTSYKYVLHGSGQVVASYVGPKARPFVHKALRIDAHP